MSEDQTGKPIVVGLYGIAGCGKTYLLGHLRESLNPDHYLFFEGSEVLANVVPGGLPAFIVLSTEEKNDYREQAITKIADECATKDRVGVVTGHFMFWQPAPTGSGSGEAVITPADLRTYTHILYLDIPIESVLRNRRIDAERGREWMSHNALGEWQRREKHVLPSLCIEHDILFSCVRETLDFGGTLPEIVTKLLEDFREHTPELNLRRAKAKIDEFLLPKRDQLETVLAMDGDRTLIDKDTGRLFWKSAQESRADSTVKLVTVDDVFSGPMGYSYTGFRQATLLYEDLATTPDFDLICGKVLDKIDIEKKLVNFLKQAAQHQHVAAVVVTSGLGRLWDKIVAKAGLSQTVKVIGGGRISDGFVVTAGVKAALVDHLHAVYNVHVTAFGDSPLDLPMLQQADDAIVMVCPGNTRSKTMDAPLLDAINNGLKARQHILNPVGSQYLLDTLTLPAIHMTHQPTLEHLLARKHRLSPQQPTSQVRLLHATERPSAKLLASPARNAAIEGPALRDVHFRIGQYLAAELVTEVVGLEEYPILHVQGHCTTAHRLHNEMGTVVVAIMRGGEPMAFGVSAAFPKATFVHARKPEDIQGRHVWGQRNVILVDSVINNGTTVIEFVQRLATLYPKLEHVVVVAGVVQAGAVAEDGPIVEALGSCRNLSVVALRLSTNQYTGRGATDTGNRLFNTTDLD